MLRQWRRVPRRKTGRNEPNLRRKEEKQTSTTAGDVQPFFRVDFPRLFPLQLAENTANRVRPVSFELDFLMGVSVEKLLLICTVIHPVLTQLVWRQLVARSKQNGPSPRKYAALAFDPERQFLIVFGGLGAENRVYNDTWVLDIPAGRWYESREELRPPGRYGSVYGFYNGRMIVATGCSEHTCYDDVWSFTSASFVWQKATAGGVLRAKPRKHAAGGIYPGSNIVMVSGGETYDSDFLSDTVIYELTQNRWHQIEGWRSTYDPSFPHARARQSSTMIAANKLLTFGGCIKHGECPSAMSWLFDWHTIKWKRLTLCASARSDATMGTITVNNLVYAILFGGNAKGRQVFTPIGKNGEDELAVFNVSNQEWTIRLTSGDKKPEVRSGASFVSSGAMLYLFGGETTSGRLINDVFTLSGDPASSFLQPCGKSFFTLISLHGLFMFLGFAVLLQFGSALAQFSTMIRQPTMFSWPYLHKVSQTLGAIFVFCGFICGIAVLPDGRRHFQSVHGGLGLFIFLVLVLQALLGFLSVHYRELKRKILMVHFWLGVAILLLSYVNISLGLFLSMSSTTLWILWFVYVLVLFATQCSVLTYDCCKEKRRRPLDDENKSEMTETPADFMSHSIA